uniref:Uncharacterized protein n=1 Tax=uncultured Thiotrichaceae bacterium TaxID=298394 RepID=A0A6S6U706_9GAMM|nr:MAG: Unknown protein [uncultured Thiotrichaceae bacterium]
MKITVNYFRYSIPALAISGGLVLSGCAPIPQAYPAAVQPRTVQQTNNVPQAAPLLPRQQSVPQQAPSVQRYAARSVQQPAAKVTAVPPMLQPAQRQQQAKPVAAYRPTQQSRQVSTVTTRKPVSRNTVSSWTPVEKRVPPKAKVVKKKVIKQAPVPPGVTPRTQQRVVAPVQKKPEQTVEVLDMSTAITTPVAEKVVPTPPVAPTYNSNPAVTILTKQANNQLVAGKTDRAASTLERALRIAPDNAMLWLRLAEVNEQQGKKVQAASMAKKAIGLSPDDANIKQRGTRLIN